MPNRRPTGRGKVNRHTHPKRSAWKRLYVTVLLFLLPTIMKAACALSKAIKAETDYLGPNFTFALTIDGFKAKQTFTCTGASWRKAKANEAPLYTIAFRDLDYAYEVFSGTISLKDALAARLFTTHGPNDKGVAITYLFTVILKAFFGWRRAYRR